MDWSFSGCGFLGVYHVGVASCLREYAPHLVNKIFGASGGALAGCCLICNGSLSEAISILLAMVAKARSKSLGPLHPSFNIIKILKIGLNNVLPSNAHEIASGRLYISMTRVNDTQNVIVSQFKSKDDLIQALICSSFIPVYCGIIPPTFQGTRYLDGGITDNQPVFDDNTITISPFAGETDICPLDPSNSFFSFEITNTNVQINSRNVYRLCCALFPPSAEMLNDMCTQGFEDTLRFLQRRSLISCVRCLCLKTRRKSQSRFIRRESSPPIYHKTNNTSKNAEKVFPCGNNGTVCKTSSFKSLLPIRKNKRGVVNRRSSFSSIYLPSASSSALYAFDSTCYNSTSNKPPNLSILNKKHANGKCVECRIPLCTLDMKIFDITPLMSRREMHNSFKDDEMVCSETSAHYPATISYNDSVAREQSKEFSHQIYLAEPQNKHLFKEYVVEEPSSTTNNDYDRYKQLPPSISEAFKVACQKMDKGLLNYIMRLPPMKLIAYYIYICLFPMDLFMSITLRFFDWIPYLPGDLIWIFGHLVPMIRLFLKKLCDQKSDSKASLTCEFAVIHENYYEDYKEAAKASYFDHYQLSSLNLEGPLL